MASSSHNNYVEVVDFDQYFEEDVDQYFEQTFKDLAINYGDQEVKKKKEKTSSHQKKLWRRR